MGAALKADGLSRALRLGSDAPYRRLVGVGGIGAGIFFALEGDHDLGRNESRPGRLLDVRDYCKLHIVAQYPTVLLGAREDHGPFHVVPVGKVGIDEVGLRLRAEMERAGMDVRFVDAVPGRPTLLSVCFQYPDGSGGNVTTIDSAASLVGERDVDAVERWLSPSAIALAAPEVPLPVRRHLLRRATEKGALRVASLTTAEIPEALETGFLSVVDLLSLNEEEAAALVGEPLAAEAPEPVLRRLAESALAAQPAMRLVVTAGARGAFAFSGRWTHVPPLRVPCREQRRRGGRAPRRRAGGARGRPPVRGDHRPPRDTRLATARDRLRAWGARRRVQGDVAAHDPARSLPRRRARFRARARRRLWRAVPARSARRREAPPCLLRLRAVTPRATHAACSARSAVEILALARALVRTDSVSIPPDGHETAAQEVLARALRRHRVEVELYDVGFLRRSRHPYVRRDRKYRGRKNLVARVPGTGRGRSLLLSGHIDTVPTRPNPWQMSPWSGAVRKGRLYGRGSWDMKGGLAAQCAVAIALRKAGVRPGGDLLVESVVDEEFAGGGGTLAGRLHGTTADACAIAEPTNEAVLRASRGGHFFDIVCRAGDPSAYFSKDEVVSPAVPMGRLLGWIDAWTAKRRQVDRGETYRDFPDPAPVQVLALEANRFDPDIPWSVPLEARVRVYFQFLPHEDVRRRVAEIDASLRDFAAADPFFREHPLEVRGSWIRRSRATSSRPITPGRAASTARRAGRARTRGPAHGLRVAVRRVPDAEALRRPDARVRPAGRGRAQRRRVRGDGVDPAHRRGLPGRGARVVRGMTPLLPALLTPAGPWRRVRPSRRARRQRSRCRPTRRTCRT